MATEQELNPHKSLVEVRNSIQFATECGRKQAAEIANQLTGGQCDAVVAADGDKKKIEDAIQPAKKQAEAVKEQAAKPTHKKTTKQ